RAGVRVDGVELLAGELSAERPPGCAVRAAHGAGARVEPAAPRHTRRPARGPRRGPPRPRPPSRGRGGRGGRGTGPEATGAGRRRYRRQSRASVGRMGCKTILQTDAPFL